LKNPTNYGIYQYTSGRGKKMLKLNPARARAMPPTVFVPDAFPGWGTPDDYVRVAALGAHAPRPTLKYRDERGPRLPLDVRCSNPLEEGRVCGHLLTPFYDARRKRVAYRSTGCGFKSYQHGHPYAHTTGMNREELEGAIVTAVRWAFDADTTERALGSFDLRTSLVLEEFHRISAKMHDIERDMESAARSADAHAKAGRESRATKAREREAEHERLYLEQLSKRDALGRPEDVAALSKVEERRIRALALDVERLLSAASKHRSILWQLLGALDLKAWVRRLGAGTFEVDVEFPGDVILRQVVLTKRIMATQQQAAWAAARLADGAAAEDVATELNAAKVRPVPIPFTADRVINAAAAYRQRHPLPGLPPGAVRLDMLDAPVSLDPLRARPRR
jgi:hypothetical protein